MHTGLESVICRLVVGVEVVITACAEVRPDGHLPSCVGYSRRSAGCHFVLMYHKYPGLGSSPEAKLTLLVSEANAARHSTLNTGSGLRRPLLWGLWGKRFGRRPAMGQSVACESPRTYSWVPAGQKGDRSRGIPLLLCALTGLD